MISNDEEFVTTIPSGGHTLILLDNEGVVDMIPILAFLVYRSKTLDRKGWSTTLYPATAHEVYDDDSQSYAILRPDGVVEEPFCASYESLEFFKMKLAERKAGLAA